MKIQRRLLTVSENSDLKNVIVFKGWFVIESQMNQMLLTVKIKENLRNQQVVNSNPRKDMKGQVWMWKEDNIVSQLDTNLVLDGSFGKVSVNNKKHGNIYQKWRYNYIM